MQLVSTNLPGNLHAATSQINTMGLAEFVLSLDYNGGGGTVAVFKVSDEMAPELRRYFNVLPEYIENPTPKRTWSK